MYKIKELEIEDIQKIKLDPDDVLLITHTLTGHDYLTYMMKDSIRRIFNDAGIKNKIIFKPSNYSLTILSKEGEGDHELKP